jgi:thiol:disulfide interchange protein DsbG
MAIPLGVILSLSACHKKLPFFGGNGPRQTITDPNLEKSANLLIRTLSRGTATVFKLYPGPDGLVGVIYRTQAGALRVVWMTPRGIAIISGPVITSGGQDLTRIANSAVASVESTLGNIRQSESSHPTSPSALLPETSGMGSPSEGSSSSGPGSPGTQGGIALPGGKATLAKMSKSDFLLMSKHLQSVAVGSGPRDLYIYADPNCIFCNRLWEEMKPYAGKVTAHWILVGFLKKTDSLKKATAILQSKNRLKALTANEETFDKTLEEGGFPIPSDDRLDVTVERAVATSTIGLGQATGELATPTLVFLGRDGQPHDVMGLPPDLGKVISEIHD